MSQQTMQKQEMWILSWVNRLGQTVNLTHQYEHEIYKFGELLINEGKDIKVCPME